MAELFGITGWKDTGKTTLTRNLVSHFVSFGLRVSTIKHAHEDFDIDHVGTDSFAHREAGAHEVAIASPKRWAIMHEATSRGAAPTLETMLARLSTCDLVLVEGYKSSPIPKIECILDAQSSQAPIWTSNKSVVAIASPAPDAEAPLPHFDISAIGDIADYITERLGLRV
ncbi:MAG: molybdopterin-guanine dinucleotide biosynthesis protein B [Ahrensia sp.]|nr:molybdopterin-guanine dinucleotide biosynthesis protein B [Ahrensia sp.]